MRIIGGKFKGKKIFIPSSKNTRPLKDLVKESIFNLLMHSNKISCSLHNSKILDLFSGIGSFGLECISRYSSKVIFFENYLETLKILRQNLNLIGDSNAVYQVIEEDCFKFFDKVPISILGIALYYVVVVLEKIFAGWAERSSE